MNQISRSDLKISASERRARKSILLALAQIRQAVDHQLQVLSECADGVSHIITWFMCIHSRFLIHRSMEPVMKNRCDRHTSECAMK